MAEDALLDGESKMQINGGTGTPTVPSTPISTEDPNNPINDPDIGAKRRFPNYNPWDDGD